MARIRSIKPEFFRHHDLYTAEIESKLPLRTAFSGLWCIADREGRFKWKPVQLKLDVLPYDVLDFAEVLKALCDSGFITYYEVDGKPYGFIPTFTEHQRITGSEATSESKIPAPPINSKKGNNLESTRNNNGNDLDDREREGKGKGKGKGKGEGKGEGIGKVEPVSEIIFLNPLQKIYDKSWDEYSKLLNKNTRDLTEKIFLEWKKFVDFIWENDNYHEVFKSKFITPHDFGKLLSEKKFLPDKWGEVLELMLSTGITENQNLFFRIPQFMGYVDKNKIKINGTSSKADYGGLNKTRLLTAEDGKADFGDLRTH